jgi:hypothetical protein
MKDKNRLLKVCYVPANSASLPRLFLLISPHWFFISDALPEIKEINQD